MYVHTYVHTWNTCAHSAALKSAARERARAHACRQLHGDGTNKFVDTVVAPLSSYGKLPRDLRGRRIREDILGAARLFFQKPTENGAKERYRTRIWTVTVEISAARDERVDPLGSRVFLSRRGWAGRRVSLPRRTVTVKYQRRRRANNRAARRPETTASPRLCVVHHCCPEAATAIRSANCHFSFTSRPCSPTVLRTKATRRHTAPAVIAACHRLPRTDRERV